MRKQLLWAVAMAALGCEAPGSGGPHRSGSGEAPQATPTADAGPVVALTDDASADDAPDRGGESDPSGTARDAGSGSLPTDAAASSEGADGGGEPASVEDPVTGELGSACDVDEDCNGELTCLREGGGMVFPRGYCSGPCDFESATCGTAGDCAWLGERTVACAVLCETDDECRPDYSCQRTEARFAPETRYCLPAPSGVGGDGGEGGSSLADTGSPCSRNRDCEGGVCMTWLPGGYCSEWCDPDGPATCGDGADCVRGGEIDGFCARTCSDGSQCRPDYVCGPWGTRWGSGEAGVTYCTVNDG